MAELSLSGNTAELRDTIHVKGLSDLGKMLDTLAVKMEKNILRGAMRAAGKPILLYAKQIVPVGPPSAFGARTFKHYEGALRDSIRIEATPSKRRGSGKVSVTLKAGGKSKQGADIYYAYWVEFTGAAPHLITPKKDRDGMGIRSLTRRFLYFGDVFTPQVSHPGFSPKPFMRPALDAQKGAAIEAAAEYIKRRLTKQGLDEADNVDIEVQS